MQYSCYSYKLTKGHKRILVFCLWEGCKSIWILIWWDRALCSYRWVQLYDSYQNLALGAVTWFVLWQECVCVILNAVSWIPGDSLFSPASDARDSKNLSQNVGLLHSEILIPKQPHFHEVISVIGEPWTQTRLGHQWASTSWCSLPKHKHTPQAQIKALLASDLAQLE